MKMTKQSISDPRDKKLKKEITELVEKLIFNEEKIDLTKLKQSSKRFFNDLSKPIGILVDKFSKINNFELVIEVILETSIKLKSMTGHNIRELDNREVTLHLRLEHSSRYSEKIGEDLIVAITPCTEGNDEKIYLFYIKRDEDSKVRKLFKLELTKEFNGLVIKTSGFFPDPCVMVENNIIELIKKKKYRNFYEFTRLWYMVSFRKDGLYIIGSWSENKLQPLELKNNEFLLGEIKTENLEGKYFLAASVQPRYLGLKWSGISGEG